MSSTRTHLFDDLSTLPLRSESISVSTSTSSITLLPGLITTKQYVLPKIVFTAVWRDKKVSATNTMPKLIALAKQITSDHHFVFYENDSTDGTRDELLLQCGGNGTICTILVEDGVSGANDHHIINASLQANNQAKTTRIARARNIVLEYSENHYAHYDYMVMLDPDMICTANPGGCYDPDIFKYVIWDLGDQWDVLTFRQTPYFDWWAFRHSVILPHNYVHKGNKNPNRNDYQKYDENLAAALDNTSWPDGLLEVQSSFSFFALYRMSLLNGTARYRGKEDDGTTDCEHTAFHFDLRLKMNARHKLST